MPEVGTTAVPGGDQRRRLSRVRRTIAARLVGSWQAIPHVTAHLEADGAAVMAARAALAAESGLKIPFEAILIDAVAPVLRAFPDFNAVVEGDEVVHHARCDIGIATDTPHGLLVPVVRDADRLGVVALAQEVVRLAGAAQARELLPEAMAGSTFTVSNLGSLGGGWSVSVLPPGTSAFLSAGRARPTVRLRDGVPVEVPMIPLSITVDHRLIDGGPVIRFGSALIAALEAYAPSLGQGA